MFAPFPADPGNKHCYDERRKRLVVKGLITLNLARLADQLNK